MWEIFQFSTTFAVETIRGVTKISIGNRLVSQIMSWPAHCPVFVTFAKQSALMIVRTRGMWVLGTQLR